MNKLVQNLVFLSLLAFTGVTSLRCYHCVSGRVESFKNMEYRHNAWEAPSLFPFTDHPSCDYGNEPAVDLSINCETEAPHVAALLDGFSNEFGEYDTKIRELARSALGARFACMAMEFRHNINWNGTELTMDITYRSCYPDHRNFDADLRAFNIENARGYTCDLWNNCNDIHGDRNSHWFISKSDDESVGESSESDVAGFSSMLLLFLLPVLLLLF